MIQFMPANHLNTNRVITILINSDIPCFQNVFVTLLHPVAKDLTPSLLSWQKRYDFNAANFQHHKQWKCALQMQWIRIWLTYSQVYSQRYFVHGQRPKSKMVNIPTAKWTDNAILSMDRYQSLRSWTYLQPGGQTMLFCPWTETKVWDRKRTYSQMDRQRYFAHGQRPKSEIMNVPTAKWTDNAILSMDRDQSLRSWTSLTPGNL